VKGLGLRGKSPSTKEKKGMLMKTKFKYILLISILLLQGCTRTQTNTAKLWNPPTYTETIDQFLINTKEKSLIIIGKKYHYIFDKGSAPLNLLTWSGRKNLRAYFDDFKVDVKNIITGSYFIQYNSKKIPKDEVTWLKKSGFKIDKNGFYCKVFNIKGTRYLKRDDKLNNLSHLSHLNRKYYIRIEKPNSTSDIAYKIAMTPISVAGDTIYIGVIAASIISLPVALLGLGVVAIPVKAISYGLEKISE
jgi:hypothetical protein